MDETKEPNSTAENAVDFTKCFAYPTKNFKAKSGCTTLTEMMCKTKGKCPFFKTKAQYYDVEHYRYGGVKKGRRGYETFTQSGAEMLRNSVLSLCCRFCDTFLGSVKKLWDKRFKAHYGVVNRICFCWYVYSRTSF